MIHGSSLRLLQSIAASFGVWGYRNRFLRSIMNVVPRSWHHSSQKKISKPQLKFPLSSLEPLPFKNSTTHFPHEVHTHHTQHKPTNEPNHPAYAERLPSRNSTFTKWSISSRSRPKAGHGTIENAGTTTGVYLSSFIPVSTLPSTPTLHQSICCHSTEKCH